MAALAASSLDSKATAPQQKEPEDASKLQFGPDFQAARCLWNAEVAIILEHRVELQQKDDSDVQPTAASEKVLRETLEYVNLFKNYKNKEAIKSARNLLNNKMHAFEVAVINNLNIETAEEANTLIPTLREKFPGSAGAAELEQFLDALKREQGM